MSTPLTSPALGPLILSTLGKKIKPASILGDFDGVYQLREDYLWEHAKRHLSVSAKSYPYSGALGPDGLGLQQYGYGGGGLFTHDQSNMMTAQFAYYESAAAAQQNVYAPSHYTVDASANPTLHFAAGNGLDVDVSWAVQINLIGATRTNGSSSNVFAMDENVYVANEHTAVEARTYETAAAYETVGYDDGPGGDWGDVDFPQRPPRTGYRPSREDIDRVRRRVRENAYPRTSSTTVMRSGRGTVRAKGKIVVDTRAGEYQFRVQLQLSNVTVSGDAAFNRFAGDIGFDKLLKPFRTLTPMLHPVQLGPTFSVGGYLTPDEKKGLFSSFSTKARVTDDPATAKRVLVLGVSTSAQTQNADITAIKPFVGAQRFGYALSDGVVEALAGLMWKRNTKKGFFRTRRLTGPIDIKYDGKPEKATVTIDYTIGALKAIEVAVPHPKVAKLKGKRDALTATFDQTVTIKKVVRQNGQEVKLEARQTKPQTTGGLLSVFPFETTSQAKTDLDKLQLQLARDLTAPAFEPILSSTISFRPERGLLSAPARLFMIRGSLA